MPETPATRIDFSGPQLRADQRGYVLDGEFVDGFDDRRDLSPLARRQIAMWADAFGGDVSDVQRELLGLDVEPDRVGVEILTAATRNADVDLPLASEFGLVERLTDEQTLVVREPWRMLAGGERRDYPLTVGELAAVTGATAKQVREWENATLLPGYRIDGRRQFFSAAVVHAFALAALDRYQVAALTTLQAADADDDCFVRLVEHTLATRRSRLAESRRRFAEVAQGILGQIRAVLVSASAEDPQERSATPTDDDLGEHLARTTLARSVKLHDAFGAIASDDLSARSDAESHLVFEREKRVSKPRGSSGRTKPPGPLSSGEVLLYDDDFELFVHPASGKGWKLSADLGLSVSRKNDAVRIGKLLSTRLGDGAVRVYPRDDRGIVKRSVSR
ncbi:MAG TPA: hypothetical protein VGW75_15735 [Solirubrobacteraceae bacterium]|jgi:DNA-binding transcriptional MerR regulator|nr:hypothetical protein [Solirubrobacteraceae bacterium]